MFDILLFEKLQRSKIQAYIMTEPAGLKETKQNSYGKLIELVKKYL